MTTIGINTLVYLDELTAGVPQSALLERIAAHGVTLAEVRREYIHDDAELDLIAQAARDHGLDLYYSVPERIVTAGEPHPDFETFLAEAERMGVRNVKFNQGDVKDADAALIARIDEAAAAHGVTLTIENDQTPENGTLDCTVASLRRIKTLGGRTGYTFDLGNWYWRGEDPEAAFDQLLPAITVFHLKNVNGAAERENLATTMLDEGVIDWRPMLRRLAETTPVLLEYPIAEADLAGQIAILREALAA